MPDPFDDPIPVATSFSVPSVFYDRSNIGATGNIINSANTAIPTVAWLNAGQVKGAYPPVGEFNWFYAYLYNQLNYLRQVGIADWDARQTYNIGDSVRVVNSGTGSVSFFKSIQNNNVGNSTSNTTYWLDFFALPPVVNGNYGKQLNVNSRLLVNQRDESIISISPNRTLSNGRDFLLVDCIHAYAAASDPVLFFVNNDPSGRSITIRSTGYADTERPGIIAKAYDENFARRAFGDGVRTIKCRCRIQVDNNSNVDSIDYWSFTLPSDSVPSVDTRNRIAQPAPLRRPQLIRVANTAGTAQFVYFDFDYTIGNYFEFLFIPKVNQSLNFYGWDLTLTSDGFTNENIIGSGYCEELTNCLRYHDVIPPYQLIYYTDNQTDISNYWIQFAALKRVKPSQLNGIPSSSIKIPNFNGVSINIFGQGAFYVGDPGSAPPVPAYVYADR